MNVRQTRHVSKIVEEFIVIVIGELVALSVDS